MKCGACGARNVEDAAWCTQCYTSFAAAPEVEGAGSGVVGVESTAHVHSTADPGSTTEAGAPGEVGSTTGVAADPEAESPAAETWSAPDVRAVDGDIQWRCTTCDSWVALEAPVCGTCGAARRGFGDAPTPSRQAADVPQQTLLAAGVLLPGLGHVLAGRTGSGVTRMLLWVLWSAGGLWWVLTTEQGRLPGLVLLAGAVILWAATLVDTHAIATGSTAEPFGVRGLLWTVVGITGLLMLLVAFVAAGSLGG